MESVFEKIKRMPGKTALWFQDLTTGETRSHQPLLPIEAASVIKLFVMAEAFARFEDGTLSEKEEFTILPEMKLPSCGALTYLHDGLTVQAMDLVTLMIILSDNTATNLLIDRLGMDAINRRIQMIGAEGCRLNRKLFDSEASARGIQNYVTAEGVGRFLRLVWEEKLISPEASRRMLQILKNQRLNGKIPFFLRCPVAHKTGEDTGITHDAAIVLTQRPFVLVMLSEQTDVPRFERFMQDTARELAEIHQEGGNAL